MNEAKHDQRGALIHSVYPTPDALSTPFFLVAHYFSSAIVFLHINHSISNKWQPQIYRKRVVSGNYAKVGYQPIFVY